MNITRTHLTPGFFVVALVLLCVQLVSAQEYELYISSILIPEQKETTWYGRPVESDYIVSWELYERDEQGNPQLVDVKQLSEYHVFMCQGDKTFKDESAITDVVVKDTNSVTFSNNKVGPRYYFRMEAIKEGAIVVQSDTAWAVSGKPQIYTQIDGEDGEPNGKSTYKFPLFFPLAELLDSLGWRNEIYFNATIFGKIAFTLVWYFFLFGLAYVLPFRCIPSLYLGRLFPFTKINFFRAHVNKDKNYELYIAPRLRFVVEAWKQVMARTNDIVRDGSARGLADVDQICFDHFKKHGAPALEVIKDIIHFNPKEDNETDLEESVKNYFGSGGEFGDIISEPLTVETRYGKKTFRWNDVRNDLFNSDSKPLLDYVTIKILSGGLENHIINGFHWQEVSEEVDRAIENRAASEIENLREKSAVDWLWNLGALAPLLGLFGTVTGISRVFEDIQNLGQDTSHLEMVKQLSSGIFEALWTTIYGLMAGIVLMMIFYYFKNNLDWIYNKWQSLFVHVTEKL